MEIQIDESQLRDVQTMMTGIKDGYPKVLTRAVNKTLTGVRTDATGEISKELNLTKTRIRKDFKITKMTWTKLKAKIDSTGKPLGLADFTGTKPRAKGVSVKVKKTGTRSIIAHAFMTKGRGGVKDIVGRRKYKGDRVKKRIGFAYAALPLKYRYDVEWLTGPRIQDIFDEPKVMKPVMKMADDRLAVNLQRELNRELSKL